MNLSKPFHTVRWTRDGYHCKPEDADLVEIVVPGEALFRFTLPEQRQEYTLTSAMIHMAIARGRAEARAEVRKALGIDE